MGSCQIEGRLGSCCLQERIDNLDTPHTLNINWEDVGILGPPFKKIL